MVIRGDQSASPCSPEIVRSKYKCHHRGVLTRSPTRMSPEPQSCKRSSGCEASLEKPVILCRTPARGAWDATGSAARGARGSAGPLVVRTGQQGSAGARREPEQRGLADTAWSQTLRWPPGPSPESAVLTKPDPLLSGQAQQRQVPDFKHILNFGS